MNNKEIFDYSDNFLKEIIENLIKEKKENLSNPKANEFKRKFISVFGKSFNDNEINELVEATDSDFSLIINNKFTEKRIFLQTVDISWKSHIQYLEQLRQVIGLRSYGQRDPLIEYKKEAFELFENLLIKLKSDLITVLINLGIIRESVESTKKKEEPINFKKKMKRNEPCFCGSGKKYKHCHGSL